MSKKFITTVTLISVFSLLSACNSKDELFRISGHYAGTLTTYLNSHYQQISVQSDVELDQDKINKEESPGLIDVKDENGNLQIELKLVSVHDNSITLSASIGLSEPIDLVLDQGCYSATGAYKVTVCPTDSDIIFEMDDPKTNKAVVSLALHQFNMVSSNGPEADAPETPRVFPLKDAIELARKKSFQSKIEFEHVYQAVNSAKAAYLHLLPQITLPTIVSNLAVSWISLLGSIADLVPFLLPDRWFEAKAASEQSKAENDTYRLLRLNMGVQVETLFYCYTMDKQTLAFTHDLLARTQSIHDEVKIREDLGQLSEGSTANLDSILNQIQLSIDALEDRLPEDLSAIAAVLGYFDPKIVADVTIGEEIVPIENASPIDYATVNKAALERSYELDQMNDLIEVAKLQKKATYFSWLDPYGDPTLGLGAALPAKVAVASSEVREMKIDQDQLRFIVSQKVFNGTTDYATALKSFKDSTQGLSIQENLLEIEQEHLHAGTKVDLFGLVQILQNYLAAEVNLESARANYRVARAEIDRLLLQGYYANF